MKREDLLAKIQKATVVLDELRNSATADVGGAYDRNQDYYLKKVKELHGHTEEIANGFDEEQEEAKAETPAKKGR